MSTYILGINSAAHDSAAALLKDGRLVFAAEEERFSRIKKDTSFPRRTIQAALDHEGIKITDLDAVAFGSNHPLHSTLHTIRSGLNGQLPLSRGWTVDQIFSAGRDIYNQGGLRALMGWFPGLTRNQIFRIDHHLAHAWSAYALSGFDESLVVVMDGRGEHQATSIYHGEGGKLTLLREITWPNSLGEFYQLFTEELGFEPYNDEWKVMGLAAYGEPTVPMSEYLRVTERGYKFNSRALMGGRVWDYSHMRRLFGPRREPEKLIAEDDKNLAASVQKATEAAMYAIVRDGVRMTGSRNLSLAGGVAMNSKANGRLLASGIIQRIFVQPAATDDGTAIGGAFAAYERLGQPVPRYEMEDVYLGPEFRDEAIEQTLTTFKLPVVKVPDMPRVVARLLADGKIIGWFQGRMEFGPRALGNRSILADPRDPAMKDRVNEVVKFREGWRPFAPSCLAERMDEYFAPAHPSPFMILTFDVLPEKRSVIPAVTHADNTARVQTVKRDVNPRYWALINEFDRITGVPVIMNTSFNLRGEPIVCTPKDAIRTFFSSGLDYLAIGSYLVSKERFFGHHTDQSDTDHSVARNGALAASALSEATNRD